MAKKSNPEQKVQVSQSYWALVWWKFKKNKMAIVGGVLLVLFYFLFVGIPEFISPYQLEHRTSFTEAKPQRVRFIDQEGKFHFRPFVYGLEKKIDQKVRRRYYEEDPKQMYPIYFLKRGEPYKLFGFI